jgi:hypothetical protein
MEVANLGRRIVAVTDDALYVVEVRGAGEIAGAAAGGLVGALIARAIAGAGEKKAAASLGEKPRLADPSKLYAPTRCLVGQLPALVTGSPLWPRDVGPGKPVLVVPRKLVRRAKLSWITGLAFEVEGSKPVKLDVPIFYMGRARRALARARVRLA